MLAWGSHVGFPIACTCVSCLLPTINFLHHGTSDSSFILLFKSIKNEPSCIVNLSVTLEQFSSDFLETIFRAMIMSVFFISELLATSIFGNENSSLEQLMKSTGFQNPNLRLSCLLSSSLTTTQLWGYVLFLRMSCIKHDFGMKKGRSTGKTDRIRPGKAPGRPAYTPWAGQPRPGSGSKNSASHFGDLRIYVL